MPMTHFRRKFLGSPRFSGEKLNGLVCSCSSSRRTHKSASALSDQEIATLLQKAESLPGRFPGAQTYESAKGSACRRRLRMASAVCTCDDMRQPLNDWYFRSC